MDSPPERASQVCYLSEHDILGDIPLPPATMVNKDTSILIIGGGTFGLSTAYSLAKAGYANITVLEQSSSIPPTASAGNDLNKIIRAEYEDPFYANLALQAIQQWQTHPLFTPHYHQTGYLLATSSAAPQKAKLTLQKSLASIASHPVFADQIQPLTTREQIRAVAPALDGAMHGWTGYLNKLAGYAHSADALSALYGECVRLGVAVRAGDGAARLLFDSPNDGGEGDGGGSTCVGARTVSGTELRAERIVLTVGASLGRLLPRAGKQITAKAWSVGHVQLTEGEAAKLRGIPVTYARDLGFFFEPDGKTGLLKVCPAGAGYTNFVNLEGGDGGLVSLPPDGNDDKQELDGWIPSEDEACIRALLHETLPALADRPIIQKKLCWCADAADTEYVIDYVPGIKNLVVVTGDSGHAFKMLPVAGDWVRDVLEKGTQEISRWRWKEARGGADEVVSWRVGRTTDLKEVKSAVTGSH